MAQKQKIKRQAKGKKQALTNRQTYTLNLKKQPPTNGHLQQTPIPKNHNRKIHTIERFTQSQNLNVDTSARPLEENDNENAQELFTKRTIQRPFSIRQFLYGKCVMSCLKAEQRTGSRSGSDSRTEEAATQNFASMLSFEKMVISVFFKLITS